MTTSKLWPVAAALSLLLLALHLLGLVALRDPGLCMPHLVAWTHDVLLLGPLAALFAAADRLAPQAVRAALALAGRLVLVATAMLLSVYPLMLPAFLMAPVSFLEVDGAVVSLFVHEYAGLRVLWPVAAAAVVGLLAPHVPLPRPGRRGLALAAPLALLALAALGPASPNPVVFGLQDRLRRAFVERVVPRLRVDGPAGAPIAAFDWTETGPPDRYDHVILAVLESVTSAEFEAAAVRRNPDSFFGRHRSHSRYFSNHHTLNLDSYTSLIAMTTGILVPFRSYAAPERYRSVNDAPNMVRALGRRGFRTLFVSTYEHQPFVPNRREWEEVLARPDLGDLSGFVSLGWSRMESATEDRAALPRLVDFVASSPRSLVLAEFVYGHSPAWQAEMGLTAVEYGDRYLQELWARLEARGLAERTLLVVVSDHGTRSRPAERDTYRVPLVVVGAGVAPGEDRAFRCHLDLQAIVAHYLTGSPLPPARSETFVVGSTERWIYGLLRADGTGAVLDDGTGSALWGEVPPAVVHGAFQSYVGAFSRRFVSPSGSRQCPRMVGRTGLPGQYSRRTGATPLIPNAAAADRFKSMIRPP